MVYAAVLGFGTVGSGVVELIDKYQDMIRRAVPEGICVKYILDIRTFPESPYGHLVTDDFESIVNDPDISVICEVMGGTGAAYQFTKSALSKGISVCTSNKELVISKGAELMSVAAENNCRYYFEASVGGGIPLIRPLTECLAQEKITAVTGILNGTTNYMLTRMRDEGADFNDVLKQAQQMGYAERDPSADVEGRDACRKISILASLICGSQVDPGQVPCTGITDVIPDDFEAAGLMGCRIRLLGDLRIDGNGDINVVTGPFMIPAAHPLAGVDGVFNAVCIHGEMVDDVMFYGRGAGKDATASAVVADVLCAAGRGGSAPGYGWKAELAPAYDPDRVLYRYLLRTGKDDAADHKDIVRVTGPVGKEGHMYLETAVISETAMKEIALSMNAEAVYRFL